MPFPSCPGALNLDTVYDSAERDLLCLAAQETIEKIRARKRAGLFDDVLKLTERATKILQNHQEDFVHARAFKQELGMLKEAMARLGIDTSALQLDIDAIKLPEPSRTALEGKTWTEHSSERNGKPKTLPEMGAPQELTI